MLRALKISGVFSLLLATALGVPASASVEYHQQSAVGQKLKLPVHEWVNSEKQPVGIVVANQGLVFSGKAYDSLARHLAADGYKVYALDFRGFGDWTRNTSEFTGDPAIHFTQTKEDLTAVLKQLREDYPGTPICLMGESFGANYAIWEASTEPTLVDGVIATSTCFQLCVHPRPLWFYTFAVGIVRPKHPLNVAPYLAPILSEDRSLTDKCLKDPEVCTRMSGTDLVKAMITNRYSLEQLEKIPHNMPILLIAGQKDQVQNSNKIKSVLNRIGSKKVKVALFPQRGHLLLEHQSVDPDVARTVDSWLAENISTERPTSDASKQAQHGNTPVADHGVSKALGTPSTTTF